MHVEYGSEALLLLLLIRQQIGKVLKVCFKLWQN